MILNYSVNIRFIFGIRLATLSTFCGNQIVEEGEECDCGYNDDECDDQCCIPRRAGSGDTSKRNERACKRTPGSICSPSEGPCCESDCNFSPKSEHQLKLCEIESECTETSYCDGISPQCPIPMAKPSNETLCNNGTQVELYLTITFLNDLKFLSVILGLHGWCLQRLSLHQAWL